MPDIPTPIGRAMSSDGEPLAIFESPFGGAPVAFRESDGAGPYGKVAGCPNCGKYAGEWRDATAAHIAGCDWSAPCSLVCKYQLEHQADIASQRLTETCSHAGGADDQ